MGREKHSPKTIFYRISKALLFPAQQVTISAGFKNESMFMCVVLAQHRFQKSIWDLQSEAPEDYLLSSNTNITTKIKYKINKIMLRNVYQVPVSEVYFSKQCIKQCTSQKHFAQGSKNFKCICWLCLFFNFFQIFDLFFGGENRSEREKTLGGADSMLGGELRQDSILRPQDHDLCSFSFYEMLLH